MKKCYFPSYDVMDKVSCANFQQYVLKDSVNMWNTWKSHMTQNLQSIPLRHG